MFDLMARERPCAEVGGARPFSAVAGRPALSRALSVVVSATWCFGEDGQVRERQGACVAVWFAGLGLSVGCFLEIQEGLAPVLIFGVGNWAVIAGL